MNSLSKLNAAFARGLIAAAAIGLILMTLIVGWQVYGRYILNKSPDWSEQAALALMIWYVCLAAAAGIHQNFHIRIVALEEKVSGRTKSIMALIRHGVTFFCGVIMGVYGIQLVAETWVHAVPTLPFTRGMVYLVVPISGVLIALFSTELFFTDISKNKGTSI